MRESSGRNRPILLKNSVAAWEFERASQRAGRDAAFTTAMNEFIRDRCPDWTGYFLRAGGRELTTHSDSARKPLS